MAYQKTNWVNGYTPLNASNMNKIEEGIFNNDTFLSSLDVRVETLEGKIGQGGINSVNVSGNGNALTNVNYNSSTKILNFDKNNTFALDSDLDSVNKKNLYHLGAYDSVNGNVITRRTGYLIVRGNSFSWDSDTPYSGFNGIYKGNALKDVITTAQGASSNQILVYGNNGYIGIERRNATNVDKCVCIQAGNSVAETYLMFRDTSTSSKAELIEKLNANPVEIQYKLATPYTEEIIENQPLNTLDQTGSQWLRSEWEKGLNLFEPTIYKENVFYSWNGSSLVENSNNDFNAYKMYLKAGTYTLSATAWCGSICTLSGSTLTILKNIPTTSYTIVNFNLTTDTYIVVSINKDKVGTSAMLNEGSHPYPYHVYQGRIVREDQLVQRKLFSAKDSTMNDVKSFVNTNYYRIISIMYFAESERHSMGRSVIYNADSDSYFYINSDRTFSDVQLNSNATQNRYDYIYIHYHKY